MPNKIPRQSAIAPSIKYVLIGLAALIAILLLLAVAIIVVSAPQTLVYPVGGEELLNRPKSPASPLWSIFAVGIMLAGILFAFSALLRNRTALIKERAKMQRQQQKALPYAGPYTPPATPWRNHQ